jgi:site-specific recombinase XerD
MRRRELERFRIEHGDRALHRLDQDAVKRLVGKKRPHPAINFLKALSPFLEWCVGEKLIASNPAVGVQRPKVPKSDGFATWTDELVEQYRAHHKVNTKARQAFELLVNVGAARIDTALLGRQHVRNGFLVYRRHKTGVLIEIPILPDLQAVIDTMAGDNLAFIATDRGTPYTKESFGNMFRDWCNVAGIAKGYSAHGLRKYAAKVRAELGATVPELMAWFGWMTMREAERYTRAADRRKMAVSLGQKVNPKLSTSAPG